jgi:putative endopeptidase
MRPSRFALLFLSLPLSLPCFPQNQAPANHQPVLDVSSMDKSIDPCVDFFAYACGGWIRKNPILPDPSSWSVYGKLQDENEAQLPRILENAAAASG